MRYSILLIVLFSSTLLAEDIALVWTVPGRVKAETAIAYPVAQSPLVVNDRLVVTIFPPNYLLGSDDMFGKRLWEFPWIKHQFDDEGDFLPYSTPRMPRQWGNRTTSFATDESRDLLACVDSESGTMFTFDLKLEGKIKWCAFGRDSDDATLQEMRSLGPPCIVSENAFCLVTSDRDFMCVNLNLYTGKIQSQIKLSAAKPTHQTVRFSPVLAGTRLICPCPTNELVSVANLGREVEWRAALDTSLSSIYRLDATDRNVLVLSNGVATCLETSGGKLVWSRDGLGLYPFLRIGDTQIIGSDISAVAIDIPTGNERWRRSLTENSRFAANGTMHNGKLMLPMIDNAILSFDIDTGNQAATLISDRGLGHLFSTGDYLYSLTQSDLDKLSLEFNASPKKAEP